MQKKQSDAQALANAILELIDHIDVLQEGAVTVHRDAAKQLAERVLRNKAVLVKEVLDGTP